MKNIFFSYLCLPNHCAFLVWKLQLIQRKVSQIVVHPVYIFVFVFSGPSDSPLNLCTRQMFPIPSDDANTSSTTTTHISSSPSDAGDPIWSPAVTCERERSLLRWNMQEGKVNRGRKITGQRQQCQQQQQQQQQHQDPLTLVDCATLDGACCRQTSSSLNSLKKFASVFNNYTPVQVDGTTETNSGQQLQQLLLFQQQQQQQQLLLQEGPFQASPRINQSGDNFCYFRIEHPQQHPQLPQQKIHFTTVESGGGAVSLSQSLSLFSTNKNHQEVRVKEGKSFPVRQYYYYY